MPKKESGMWKNKNAPMSKNYRAGGALNYNKGGGTEVGKEASSYKEYVKEMFGGGETKGYAYGGKPITGGTPTSPSPQPVSSNVTPPVATRSSPIAGSGNPMPAKPSANQHRGGPSAIPTRSSGRVTAATSYRPKKINPRGSARFGPPGLKKGGKTK